MDIDRAYAADDIIGYRIMRKHFHIRGGYKELWSYRHEPEQMRILATVLWLGMLGVASLVMLASLTYGFLMLINALGMEDVSVAPSLSSTPFTRVELQNTLREFEVRSVQYETRKIDTETFANPFSASVQ